MTTGQEVHSKVRASIRIVAAVAATLILASVAGAASEHVIFSFNEDYGEYPDSDLVLDAAGNIYATTVGGGDFGSGAVVRLSPSAQGWKETVLYSFHGSTDGSEPYGGVTLDAQGNVYGTTVAGGSFAGASCIDTGCGVAFKLTRLNGVWIETVIHSFAGGADGYGPGAGLAIDRQGDLYGATPTGGADGAGVIYELTPGTGGKWREAILHTFSGGLDGIGGSAGRLLLDRTGNLWGVATAGGQYGSGTAFELSPAAGGAWRFNTLYAFRGQPDAGFPYGALVADGPGNLYGTTYYDGANDLGSVYRLSLGNGIWTETVLHSFQGGSDGSGPISNLVFDAAGNLYGTTSEGGAPGCDCGLIFKMTRGAGGQWTESVAYSFQGPPDAAFPYNGLASAGAGVFFGPTVHGGADDEGSIFSFRP
ncbi:MAG TPA: choice-of-anchor tandem repeat GloVer-containing protein [Terriglobia bacterium]|nr:choice-of-anchor tandem repeat GloVer-containing protein [Terriglobia bacterium]